MKTLAEGQSPIVSIRLPQPLIDRLDTLATRLNTSRSGAVRRLIEIAEPSGQNKSDDQAAE